MPVVIGEIVTEVVVAPPQPQAPPGAGTSLDDAVMEPIVRRATERVLEILRREWDL
ncbi:DUF5908 family protein [Pseudarthrobacter sp. NIBRBAC000502772]|uniref:DUF5908 family protein n=1 Tax=Pseudarthrobacter sp. NIBRBAC000502772 TaxID=2590775 RepID=UPI00143D8ED4|nr:DUF5908 family protein [Pseudarthrobacter sp. NIBRBAC000502772]